MKDQKIKVGITHGDMNGIGYEIITKVFADSRMCELCTPIIYGSAKAAGFYKSKVAEAETLNYNIITSARDANPKRVNLISIIEDDVRIEPGTMSSQAGAASVKALEAAAKDLKDNLIDVVVTAPICKENIQGGEFHFTGHTEFFAERFGGDALMMMVSDVLKVGLVTIHIPISQVSAEITVEKIVEKIKALKSTLTKDFSIREPRIAVLGLNPHAGDGGVIGQEDMMIVKPAIEKAIAQKVLAFGPFAADGFFAAGNYTKYDAVLAMYHDQGLAPFKALSHGGVNYTAGLPIVRTSPAHGVGFDIAGTGSADETAMRDAIYLATDIIRSRRIFKEITANPLQKFKRETGADVSVLDLPDQDDK